MYREWLNLAEMKREFKLVQLLLLGVSLGVGLPAAPAGDGGADWVFEGQVTAVDPVLSPALQSGWVLSGGFRFVPIEMEEEPVGPEHGGGRLSGGVSRTEVSIDLYYQIQFEATQAKGLVGFDYLDNDPENEGRDLYSWFFPVQGALKESGWSSRWLQVWLADPKGEMIPFTPPTISPRGLDFAEAWFRLTFVNEGGEVAHVDGRMEVFAPAGETDLNDEVVHWRWVAADLGNQLLEKESVIAKLREDLASAQLRLSGLKNMVDLLVEERQHLQSENRFLEERAAAADPAVEEQLTELTAEKSLLENEIAELSEMNRALAEGLAVSEVERRGLLDRLAELESGDPTGDPALSGSREVEITRNNQPVGRMTIIEEPMVIEKPVLIENTIISSPSPAALETEGTPEREKPASIRRRGPRKFRS